MKDIFYHDAYFNYAKFNNPRMDSLLDRGLKELNEEKRREIYKKAHQTWLEELPMIPLFNLYYYMGVSKKIKIPPQRYELVGSVGDFLFNIQAWPCGAATPTTRPARWSTTPWAGCSPAGSTPTCGRKRPTPMGLRRSSSARVSRGRLCATPRWGRSTRTRRWSRS